jgi:hypothetical protein
MAAAILGHVVVMTCEHHVMKRKIAVEFDSGVGTARALARAIYWTMAAADVTDGSATVDGFSMLASDGWTGDYRITIEQA